MKVPPITAKSKSIAQEMLSERALVASTTLITVIMRENGKKASGTAKEKNTSKAKMSTKAITKEEKPMEKEFISGGTEKCTKANGKMALDMAKESGTESQETPMKETGSMGKHTATAFIYGRMVLKLINFLF